MSENTIYCSDAKNEIDLLSAVERVSIAAKKLTIVGRSVFRCRATFGIFDD